MKKRTGYLFVFNGYADWEPALAMALLQKHSDLDMRSFSVDGKPVRSMGGLNVSPELLPGGDCWEQDGNPKISPLIERFIEKNILVAAICGATLALARGGHFNKTNHTSNGLAYLKSRVAPYQGEPFYQHQPCVTDRQLITANGAAPIDFAMAIFKKLEMADRNTLENIEALYQSSGMDYRF
jgi:hypothetical protein